MLQEAEEKKRSRHGPRCGHTPLDIVSEAWYITIEHALREHRTHSYLVLLFAIPTPFFSFPMFFLLVHALFSLHSFIIDILQSMI